MPDHGDVGSVVRLDRPVNAASSPGRVPGLASGLTRQDPQERQGEDDGD